MEPDPMEATTRDPAAARPLIGRAASFWGLALTGSLLLFASSAPSPLYVVYQDQWGFSDTVLTSVFAVYALALLAALLTVGSVSDHIGRRPTLRFALVLEIVAMALFAEAGNVGGLFAARALQGFATGVAMGAISAALIDLQPIDSPRRGALVGAVAPLSGLAVGALGAGLLVEYGPDPTHLVFWLLTGVFALALAFAAAIPEPVATHERLRRRMLRPNVEVPPSLRGAFLATIPCLVASWALGGLVLSLGASLTADVLGDGSHLVGGLPIFIMAGLSAVASVWMRNMHARTTARGGLAALMLGVAVVLASIQLNSLGLFLAGSAIAGLGFGPAFAGAFRALSNQAPIDHRGALVSAILVVSYLAFSLPAVIAGTAVGVFGLEATAKVYGLALIAIAAVALALSGRMRDPQSEGVAGPSVERPAKA
jgi:MFS family permease